VIPGLAFVYKWPRSVDDAADKRAARSARAIRGGDRRESSKASDEARIEPVVRNH